MKTKTKTKVIIGTGEFANLWRQKERPPAEEVS